MQFVVYLHQADPDDSRLGGKARSLARMMQANFPVPPGFVVLPEAFETGLTEAQQQQLQTHPETIEDILNQFQFGEEASRSIQEALAAMGPHPVAVRSSAGDEDGTAQSFAGQLESFLCVPVEAVPEKVEAVWRSGFARHVLEYRKLHDISTPLRPPAVIVQTLVPADVAGVAFGANPVTGETGNLMISALYGFGTGLVSGEMNADVFTVDPGNVVLSRQIAHKNQAYGFDPDAPGGISLVEVPSPHSDAPCLTDEQIGILARVVRGCNELFGYPQDVEWAIAQGKLFLLQSRPITSPLQERPDEMVAVWSDEDLESWMGITTPMTFSFIRRMYRANYRQICQIMRVPAATIERLEPIFWKILGCIRGRIFYNLVSTEMVWSTVPGFIRFRAWFVDFLGDTDPWEQSPNPPANPWTVSERLMDSWAIARTVTGIVWDYLRWETHARYFYRQADQLLLRVPSDLSQVSLDRLVHHYHQLESLFGVDWWIPTENTYFASFFYTWLGKLLRAWCGQDFDSLKNDLLSEEGGINSRDAIEAFDQLVQMAMHKPDLTALLCQGEPEGLSGYPEFRAAFETYLKRYGERCHEDLKLESPNIQDDPGAVLQSVGMLSRQWAARGGRPVKPALREQAEKRVHNALGGHWLRKWVLNWVIHQARRAVRHRENMRFAQTRVMGRIRTLVREMGHRLHGMAVLSAPEEVFYLGIDEIIAYAEGCSVVTDFREPVRLRRLEWENYRTMPAPPSVFTSRGVVYRSEFDTNRLLGALPDLPPQDGSLQGVPGCPGLVAGPVRLIHDPQQAQVNPGDILVAEYGDPGMVMLFPTAGGLLFEKGSPLSHLAIVAREMGIPTILSIPGVMRWVQEGEWIEMDGQQGWIKKTGMPLSAAIGPTDDMPPA